MFADKLERNFIILSVMILTFYAVIPTAIGTPSYPQDAGRLRVPQSPSNRATRVGNVNVSTPIPSSRVGAARTPYASTYLDDNVYGSDVHASPSTRVPAYQVTRVPSSPAISRPRAFYDPVMEQQFIEADPYRPSSFNTNILTGTDSTELYAPSDDSLPIYLETQSPPPYIDDLPERKRSRRKRSESRMSINEGGSEYGEEYEDAADAALASYPRSSRGPTHKKKRHMTEEERIDAGRTFKATGRDKGKRIRPSVEDDARSETSSTHTPAKRRRLIDQELTDFEDDVYDEPMQIDDGNYSESEWATGPSPLRRRSSSSSHYSAQGDRNTMSRSKPQSSGKRSRSKSRRSLRADSANGRDDLLGNGMDVTNAGDAEIPNDISHSPSSLKSLSNLSNLATANPTAVNTPRVSVPPTPANMSVAGSVAATPAASVVPSTNPSPTKNGESHTDAIPLLTPQHSGVFGVPLPSTPSSLMATSARQSRLQLLRDQSHNIGSPTTTSTAVQTPTTSTNSISRIPLSYSASKRSLEPPVVSFTPVPEATSTPRSSTPEITDAPYDTTLATSAATTAKDIPLKETIVVTDVSEPEEDNRINHLLTSAHQRKEDKEVKIKQAEQKEKEKQELQTNLKAGLFKPLTPITTGSSDSTAVASTTEAASAEGDKPASTTPKFGTGFKPSSATTAAPAAGPESAPKPAFTVPSTGAGGAAKPSIFGAAPKPATPSAAGGDAAAAAAPPKTSLFGAKPSTTAPAGDASPATPATPSKPSIFGAKPSAAPAPSSADQAAPKLPLFGAKPAGETAAPGATADAPTGTPKFSAGFRSAAPAVTSTPTTSAPQGLFGTSTTATTTPSATAAPAAGGRFSAPFGSVQLQGNGTQPPGFGATAPATPATPSSAPSGLFSGGGASSSTAPKPAFGTTLGSPSAGMMTSPDKPATTGGFGATTGGGFGASTPSSNGGFGAKPAGSTGGFGAKPTGATGGFGASTTGGGFGASTPTAGAAKAPTGLFGGSGASTPSATGGFGGSSTGGGFGSATPTTTNKAPTGLFGGGGASTPSTGGFGANTSSAAGGFGSTSKPSTGGLGATSTTGGFGSASKPATGFGAASPAPAAGGFGAASSAFGASKPANGGFGANVSSPAPATGGFGASTGGGFGSKPSTPSAGGFGSTTTAGGFGSSAAGGFNKPAGGFGATSGATSGAPSGLFSGGASGSSSPAPSTGGFPTTTQRRPLRRK